MSDTIDSSMMDGDSGKTAVTKCGPSDIGGDTSDGNLQNELPTQYQNFEVCETEKLLSCGCASSNNYKLSSTDPRNNSAALQSAKFNIKDTVLNGCVRSKQVFCHENGLIGHALHGCKNGSTETALSEIVPSSISTAKSLSMRIDGATCNCQQDIVLQDVTKHLASQSEACDLMSECTSDNTQAKMSTNSLIECQPVRTCVTEIESGAIHDANENKFNTNEIRKCLANLQISAPSIENVDLTERIVYTVYESEKQMPDIMKLITKDLSEPYSIYTYRYFIHNWPKLCFLALDDGNCIGAIVCKLDLHKKMVRRGYIAMLAIDAEYRRKGIASNLVKRAIRAMITDECDEVVLETEVTNKAALQLYENLGFVRDKRLFRYYLNGVDALRLKLWLR